MHQIGSIPESIGNLTSLVSLVISGGRLTGEIPDTMRQLRQLTHLDLSHNKLQGRIPPWIGELTQLKVLGLNGNRELTGCLPESLADLDLSVLRLDNTKIEGFISEKLSSFFINFTKSALLQSYNSSTEHQNRAFWCPIPYENVLLEKKIIAARCKEFQYQTPALALITANAMAPNRPLYDPLSVSFCGAQFSLVSKSLPKGLELDNQTGVISGIPLKPMHSTEISVEVTVGGFSEKSSVTISVYEEVDRSGRSDVFLLFLTVLGLGSALVFAVSKVNRRSKRRSQNEDFEASLARAERLSVDPAHVPEVIDIFLRRAMRGRKTPDITNHRSLALYKFQHHLAWKVVVWTSICTHLAMVFLQTDPKRHSNYMQTFMLGILEYTIFGVHAYDSYLYHQLYQSMSIRIRTILRVALVVLMFVELSVFLVVPIPRFLVAGRPVLLILRDKKLREITMGIASALPRMFSVFALISMFLLAFAGLAFLMFLDANAEGAIFVDINNTAWNLFLIILSPWTAVSRISSYMEELPSTSMLFFIPFLVIMVLFWINILTSVTSAKYGIYRQDQKFESQRKSCLGYQRTFALLWVHTSDRLYSEENKPVITRQIWIEHVRSMCDLQTDTLEDYFSRSNTHLFAFSFF